MIRKKYFLLCFPLKYLDLSGILFTGLVNNRPHYRMIIVRVTIVTLQEIVYHSRRIMSMILEWDVQQLHMLRSPHILVYCLLMQTYCCIFRFFLIPLSLRTFRWLPWTPPTGRCAAKNRNQCCPAVITPQEETAKGGIWRCFAGEDRALGASWVEETVRIYSWDEEQPWRTCR